MNRPGAHSDTSTISWNGSENSTRFDTTTAKKNSASARVTSAHLKDYQNFLHRLDTAVRAQQQIVRDSEQNAATHRQRWMIRRQKLESLERVLEKYRAEDNAHEDRLEQKRLDDLPNTGIQGFERD